MNNEEYANIFKVLSDPNRVKILKIIAKNDSTCVCNIIKQFDITQPTLSYHMKMLTDAGLISCSKNGTNCHYSINKNALKKLEKFFSNISE